MMKNTFGHSNFALTGLDVAGDASVGLRYASPYAGQSRPVGAKTCSDEFDVFFFSTNNG